MKHFLYYCTRLLIALVVIVGNSRYYALAQWEIMERPDANWGSVHALAEVRLSAERFILVGTEDGVFFDRRSPQSGLDIPMSASGAHSSRWVSLNAGLPLESRSVRALHVVDSTVFMLSERGGVFYTVIHTTMPIQSIFWRPISANLRASLYTSLAVWKHNAGALLLVGTNNGVWSANLPATTMHTSLKTLSWSLLGDNLLAPISTLKVLGNTLYAGTLSHGLMVYPLECTAICSWQQLATSRELGNAAILTLDNVDYPIPVYNARHVLAGLPCSGLLVASGGSTKLLLGVRTRPESREREWINISPGRLDAAYNTNINAVITGNFPDAPHTIVVGTESNGVLFSNDCGLTWYEFNEGVHPSFGLSGSTVRALGANDHLVMAGVHNGAFARTAAAAGDVVASTGRVATLSLKNLSRTAQIAESSRRTADSSRNRDLRLNVITDVTIERGVVQVTMSETQGIEIVAYNILGKKVMDIYSGDAKIGQNSITFDTTQLARGMYICVVRGKNFKLAEKFLVSR
jgi:hypothetical protein